MLLKAKVSRSKMGLSLLQKPSNKEKEERCLSLSLGFYSDRRSGCSPALPYPPSEQYQLYGKELSHQTKKLNILIKN